ncbi:F-box protein pof7 [Paramyrothecium foliicola]|nr:F-box protein pof7 [Paramyrothecium foliicola]
MCLDSELESFREKWLSDLRRSKGEKPGEPSRPVRASATADASSSASVRIQNEPPVSSTAQRPPAVEDEGEHAQTHVFEAPGAAQPEGASQDPTSRPAKKQPVSALDHYEEAMEKEAQGNMGESLKLYRKAYRLDHKVDKRYREKHFPVSTAAASKPAQAPGSSTAAQPSQKPADATDDASVPQSFGDLITSFSSLKIEAVPPEVEGMPQPPCPIADLPDELLVHILQDVAVDDVGDFVRLSLVCKHFAYLVATEQRIWRRVCLGAEVGFTAMHYHWQKGVAWEPLAGGNRIDEDETADSTLVSVEELEERRRGEKLLVTKSLVPDAYSSWQQMFRSRPRIRFNGCYISTVNYIRSGQMSTNQSTWGGSIVHIVTYYRYLRFFRDGTVISLLTTDEPAEVVHHLTRDLLVLHRGDNPRGPGQGHGHGHGSHAHHGHLPSAVMHLALRGRWRLSSAVDHPEATSPREEEGDLYVETEGVDQKYIYRLDLSLRNAGKLVRNNRRLFWRGFYSYNQVTDDWAPFTLKNGKPFFFSRVKSYGAGE